jgi:hypothetical protein
VNQGQSGTTPSAADSQSRRKLAKKFEQGVVNFKPIPCGQGLPVSDLVRLDWPADVVVFDRQLRLAEPQDAELDVARERQSELADGKCNGSVGLCVKSAP